MKIINIGILAHVDAGKTTLTESLLYTSGAIAEQGNVDKGTTRTDTMILERQRGITIQTAVTSFCWNDYKINIVDTPGHMDFLTEAYRSLSVLDGAVLVISAKDGVQAQTRILFNALQKMNIPTIIFVNKIDQNGIDLRRVYQSIKDKLTSDMIDFSAIFYDPTQMTFSIGGFNMQQIIKLNPMYWYITGFRRTLMWGISLDFNMFAVCGLCAVLSMVVGVWMFRKTQDRFVLHI